MAESFQYRFINISQGSDTFYVHSKDGADSHPRPNGFNNDAPARLKEYLVDVGRDGWEICAHLAGNNGSFSTLVLKKRN